MLARGSAKQQTDVLALNADLLEVVTEGDKHWASVRFSGTVRESPGEAPQGFEEVWNLAKPVSGAQRLATRRHPADALISGSRPEEERPPRGGLLFFAA